MSSPIRRLELKLKRALKVIPERNKATNRMKGQPYRNCKVVYNDEGEIVSWTRYH